MGPQRCLLYLIWLSVQHQGRSVIAALVLCVSGFLTFGLGDFVANIQLFVGCLNEILSFFPFFCYFLIGVKKVQTHEDFSQRFHLVDGSFLFSGTRAMRLHSRSVD